MQLHGPRTSSNNINGQAALAIYLMAPVLTLHIEAIISPLQSHRNLRRVMQPLVFMLLSNGLDNANISPAQHEFFICKVSGSLFILILLFSSAMYHGEQIHIKESIINLSSTAACISDLGYH
jgi:hypothetical protein